MNKFLLTFFLLIFLTSPVYVSGDSTKAEQKKIVNIEKKIANIEKQIGNLLKTLSELQAEKSKLEQVTKESTKESIEKPKGNFTVSSFSAEYYNSRTPKVVVKKDVVPEITLNYAWDDLGIPSEDFAAKYKGTITADEDTTVLLTVAQSWSETRVLIDGKIVYTGGNNIEKEVVLQKGTHTVEVAYVNNWHTVGFRVGFEPISEVIALNNVFNTLPKSVAKDNQILVASVYESGNDNNVIPLTITKKGKDSILFLASYSPVSWKINGDVADIKAIYITSYEPGAKVVNPGKIPVTKVKAQDNLIVYSIYPNCSDSGAIYHCENLAEFMDFKNLLENSFKSKVHSASVAYGPRELKIPGLILTTSILNNIKDQIDEARRKQQEKSNNGIDSVF